MPTYSSKYQPTGGPEGRCVLGKRGQKGGGTPTSVGHHVGGVTGLMLGWSKCMYSMGWVLVWGMPHMGWVLVRLGNAPYGLGTCLQYVWGMARSPVYGLDGYNAIASFPLTYTLRKPRDWGGF